MIKSIIFLFFCSNTKVESMKIENKIDDYFASKNVKNFYDVWQNSRKGFETAVAKSLKENYGLSRTLNLYVKREYDLQYLCHGYYINDNIVSVLLEDVYLRELPNLLMPDISASLANNVIRVETKLRTMFIDANYTLMRNRSDIIYKGDPSKSSPFALQQVQTKGHVTIIAEDCHLIGQSVVTLNGATPHIGDTTLSVTECKFFIEIYQPGLPSPPIITPYFSKEHSQQLQLLLTQPISTDFEVKLQGVIITLVNSSGAEVLDFRWSQKQIFSETRNYTSELVRRLNKATIRKNQGVIKLPHMQVMWDDGLKVDEKDWSNMRITLVTLNGLDMAYPSLRGGPIQMAEVMIVDEIRFYRLQVRGKLEIENSTFKGVYDFAAELMDVAVSIKIRIKSDKIHRTVPIATDKEQSKSHKYITVPLIRPRSVPIATDKKRSKSLKYVTVPLIRPRSVPIATDKKQSRMALKEFKVHFWRDLVLTPGNFKNVIFKSIPGDILTQAYLIQEVPKAITKHLESVLQRVVEADEEEKNEIDS